MDENPQDQNLEIPKQQDFYIYLRMHKLSGWIQDDTVWHTIEEACLAAEENLKALGAELTPDTQIFVCLSEDGTFPTPFFNYTAQE